MELKYLSFYGEEHITIEAHEKDFTATPCLVVIDSENDFTFGSEYGASIAIDHK